MAAMLLLMMPVILVAILDLILRLWYNGCMINEIIDIESNSFGFGNVVPKSKPKYDTPGWDTKVTRQCLQCGRSFLAKSKFVRFCHRCKCNLDDYHGGIQVHRIILPNHDTIK